MQWEKPAAEGMERTVEKDWSWAQRDYDLKLNKPKSDISKIEIDAAGFMADVDRSNNVYPAEATK